MDTFYIQSHLWLVERKERRRKNREKLIACLTIAGLLGWSLGAIAHHKPEAQNIGIPILNNCPLYAMDELAEAELKIERLKEYNASLVHTKALLVSEVSSLKEATNNIPAIYKYSKNPYAKLSKRERWNKAVIQPILRAANSRGIAASKAAYIIAHAKLENGYNPNPPGLNVWNIKGKGISFRTVEYYNGKKCSVVDSFRAYQSIEQACDDYLKFLSTHYPAAYNALYDNDKDLNDFLKGLDKGKYGKYATDIFYHHKMKMAYRQVKTGGIV